MARKNILPIWLTLAVVFALIYPRLTGSWLPKPSELAMRRFAIADKLPSCAKKDQTFLAEVGKVAQKGDEDFGVYLALTAQTPDAGNDLQEPSAIRETLQRRVSEVYNVETNRLSGVILVDPHCKELTLAAAADGKSLRNFGPREIAGSKQEIIAALRNLKNSARREQLEQNESDNSSREYTKYLVLSAVLAIVIVIGMAFMVTERQSHLQKAIKLKAAKKSFEEQKTSWEKCLENISIDVLYLKEQEEYHSTSPAFLICAKKLDQLDAILQQARDWLEVKSLADPAQDSNPEVYAKLSAEIQKGLKLELQSDADPDSIQTVEFTSSDKFLEYANDLSSSIATDLDKL